MAVVIKYQMNDPTTPDLVAEMVLPPMIPGYFFRVIPMPTVTPESGTREEQGGRAYIAVANVTALATQAIGRFKPTAPLKWAATNSLLVNIRAGKDLNAYYDRLGCKFFLVFDSVTNKFLCTCDSMDVVTHEVGHAILDSIRPDFWSVQALEVWAAHEAFADATAIVSAIHYDKLVEKALAETGGDLRKSNVISRLAEEIGQVVYRISPDKTHLPNCLRDAVNTFKYIDPLKLPKEGPDNQISAECHSFGRILLGAWYDILIGIFEKKKADGMAAVQALQAARNTAYDYLIDAYTTVPLCAKMTEAIGKLIVESARTHDDGKYLELVKDALYNRDILKKEIKMLSTTNIKDVEGSVKKKGDYNVVTVQFLKNVKLANKYVYSMYVKGTDLNNVNVHVAGESLYIFNKDGVLVEEVSSSEDEVYEAAMQCVGFIKDDNDVGPHPDTKWEIKDGDLYRTLIS